MDKQGLWGWWHDNQQWQNKLHRKAAHKALDIEDDEMIQANKINNGLDWKGIVAIGALAAATGLGGYFLSQKQEQTQVAPVQPAAQEPADAEYEVRVYDAQGNLLRVDPWPGSPPKDQ